jgi:hypothetical protein
LKYTIHSRLVIIDMRDVQLGKGNPPLTPSLCTYNRCRRNNTKESVKTILMEQTGYVLQEISSIHKMNTPSKLLSIQLLIPFLL